MNSIGYSLRHSRLVPSGCKHLFEQNQIFDVILANSGTQRFNTC